MLRLSCTQVLSLMVCVVLAAPAPKYSWDRPVDPDHDCKFVTKDGTVTIELPGTDHELAKRKRFNAPRILRDIEGDFVLQARVRGSFRPSVKSSVDGEEPRVAAGLVLISDDKNYLRLEYEAYRRDGEQHIGPAFKMLGEQTIEMELEPPWKQDHRANEERIYLRLDRRGDFLSEAISLDGKTWTSHIKMENFLKLPKKVKVGLAAYSTSTESFKCRFDQLKLTKGRKKSE
jgi:regulation of enolase protein 1 (concanavalin A-like superfamily)